MIQHSLLSLVALGLATVLEPQPPIAPSAWAAEHLVLPDGEYVGQKIDLSRTPHIVEPMDMLGPDSPANEVGVMKSVQSAFTTMLQCVIGHSIDRDPCDMLVVQPTDGALTDFNSTKLNRMIEATEILGGKPDGRGGRVGGKVYPQTSRSAAGSTTYEKKFSGGAPQPGAGVIAIRPSSEDN
jgi:phage terminase large subunit GpA-like protein